MWKRHGRWDGSEILRGRRLNVWRAFGDVGCTLTVSRVVVVEGFVMVSDVVDLRSYGRPHLRVITRVHVLRSFMNNRSFEFYRPRHHWASSSLFIVISSTMLFVMNFFILSHVALDASLYMA